MFFFRLPTHRINWITSSFLMGTLALTLTAVPIYLWRFGLDWFQVLLFALMLIATGFSITLGYHRLFSHITFQAALPVRLFTAIFGAAAFENSVLMWASEHRNHHKHVDHDDDPYNISKGFFHAHIGWLLFKLNPEGPYDNVADLEKDRLLRWQDRHIQTIAVTVGFVLPALLGAAWNGWSGALGGFLISGVARVVVLQHCTFLINSACHVFGAQPYSKKCSARDSFLMALFTFGEGYHNYHHEFQYDYRNGVKPWQFDPTKWMIWSLSKFGLARNLRSVPLEKIRLAEARQVAETGASDEPAYLVPGIASVYSVLGGSAGSDRSIRLKIDLATLGRGRGPPPLLSASWRIVAPGRRLITHAPPQFPHAQGSEEQPTGPLQPADRGRKR
jgi:stearoyl-CoA desaturase (delta-9 desaturase)